MGRRVTFAAIRMKAVGVYACVLALVVCIVWSPRASIDAVTAGLGLCVRTIVPTLFPFFVCCNILIRTGFVSVVGKWLTPVMRPLFNVSGAGAFAFVMGILSGYPVGAKMVVQLRDNGLISRTEARRLLPFCNNSGPLFILGAVGITLLGSQPLGIMLYAVHIASALLVGLLFSFYRRGDRGGGPYGARPVVRLPRYSVGEVFAGAIRDSVLSVLNICGYIVFFSAILACLHSVIEAAVAFVLPLTHMDGGLADGAVRGLFEMTNGVSAAAASRAGLRAKLSVIAFLLGFGGISVHTQVLGIVAPSDIGVSTYIVGKTAQGGIAALLTWAVCAFLPEQPVMAMLYTPVYTGPYPLRFIAFVVGINLVGITFLALAWFVSDCRQKRHKRRGK